MLAGRPSLSLGPLGCTLTLELLDHGPVAAESNDVLNRHVTWKRHG